MTNTPAYFVTDEEKDYWQQEPILLHFFTDIVNKFSWKASVRPWQAFPALSNVYG